MSNCKHCNRKISAKEYKARDGICQSCWAQCEENVKEPLVTVIIPCWGEYIKYLPRCLESVHNQTYKNIEIDVVTNIDNAPQGCNLGCKNAKGKYIAFLGADDTWMPDKITEQVNLMERHPGCTLCVCWSEDNRFNMKRISKAEHLAFHRDVLKAFNYSSGSTYMIRNESICQEIFQTFDESLLSGQEYDLALRLTGDEIGYAYCIPKVLVKQYSTPGQISTNWYKKVKGIWQLANKHGREYSMLDWLKVVGLLGLYTFGYIFGTKIYKLITVAKEKYE